MDLINNIASTPKHNFISIFKKQWKDNLLETINKNRINNKEKNKQLFFGNTWGWLHSWFSKFVQKFTVFMCKIYSIQIKSFNNYCTKACFVRKNTYDGNMSKSEFFNLCVIISSLCTKCFKFFLDVKLKHLGAVGCVIGYYSWQGFCNSKIWNYNEFKESIIYLLNSSFESLMIWIDSGLLSKSYFLAQF